MCTVGDSWPYCRFSRWANTEHSFRATHVFAQRTHYIERPSDTPVAIFLSVKNWSFYDGLAGHFEIIIGTWRTVSSSWLFLYINYKKLRYKNRKKILIKRRGLTGAWNIYVNKLAGLYFSVLLNSSMRPTFPGGGRGALVINNQNCLNFFIK